ncbi:ParB/RepB/Spo0J family partition protein [Burkholderia gladioli]|uniref:ParB/RepB/Spo0J family partition protein n=1 Tax=Burkholderia gladioli TaxID=28095 RepID=UPI0016417F74|nr:ParB/RepB/Spo0J family partition protein [Burkholderia gladioli]
MNTQNLQELSVDLIDRNPENPRIVFRPQEMSSLIESIRKHGVQVPISVYRHGKRYVLIDGERRWRSSIKLNRKTIPALIQETPDQLTNLLLMFNIHALREQWDLFTIAHKLPRVIDLLTRRLGRSPVEREISEETGLGLAVIRRCKLLIDLPEKHKDIILKELQKPKPQQKLTEDFYIEMERSLKTVERNMPEMVAELGKEKIRERLIAKYRSGTITNRVDFRQVAKIARAERVSADPAQAKKSLIKLFSDNSYSIENAYEESVGHAYLERDLQTTAFSFARQLKNIEPDDLDAEMLDTLQELRADLDRLLEGK